MSYAARDYHLAAIPEPYQVLGVQLLPLSLHHCILMEACGLSFVSEREEIPTLEDLSIGVLICSRHWRDGEFEAYIGSKRCEQDMKRWARKVAKQLGPQEFLQMNSRFELFHDYIARHSSGPEHWKTSGPSGAGTGAHWTQCILMASSQFGYSRQEALHCPLSLLFADYYRYAEANGAVQLMQPHEVEMIKAAKAKA